MKQSCILVVQTNPVPGREDEFNLWYGQTHLPDVLKLPGFVSARRYRLATSDASARWQYLAIYEFETDDVASLIALLKATAGTPDMMLSQAMDFSDFSVMPWVALGDRQVVLPAGRSAGAR